MSNLITSQKALELQYELEMLEGEITSEVEAKMQRLTGSVDDTAIFLDRSEALIEYLKSCREKISKKIKTIEGAIDFVEGNIKAAVAAIGDLEGDSYVFKLQKTKDKVVIEDETKLHDLFLRTKITHEPDKTAIFEALKAGKEVEGAKLVPNFSLKKTINTKKLQGG